jgi:hypothetical protein
MPTRKPASKKDEARVYAFASMNIGRDLYSRDIGDAWDQLADFLPALLCVETAVVR